MQQVPAPLQTCGKIPRLAQVTVACTVSLIPSLMKQSVASRTSLCIAARVQQARRLCTATIPDTGGASFSPA